jgi:catechol 2,3-dioxygenase-like lactoylglutathione lyase family enzyme
LIGAQRVDFVAIPVTDKERAMQFYGETLGLERDPRSHSDWPEYTLGNVTVSLVPMSVADTETDFPERIGRPTENTPFGAIAIRVPDVGDARGKLEQSGVSFEGDTFDTGVCHMAFFRDPDGNGLMLHHRYAPYHDGTTP